MTQQDSNFPLVIAEWRKNSRETIRVFFDTFNGRSVINVRVFIETLDGSVKPSRKGITLDISQTPQIAEALALADETARKQGLLK